MTYDIAIIGAGIAGASLAAELAPHASVLLLEMEDQPGYHTTGRSNALWHATYGGPGVAPLTLASLAPLQNGGFLSSRDALTIAQAGNEAAIMAMQADFADSGIQLDLLDHAALQHRIPGLRDGWGPGLLEPGCADIDVAGYHAACLKAAAQSHATLVNRAQLQAAERSNGVWQIDAQAGSFQAKLLINAAGAWADAVARSCGTRPIGIQPYRRTMVQLEITRPVPRDLPFLIDAAGGFYFRPEGETRIWLSPHDETPSPPCDAAPEEIDIALAIDRFEQVVDWQVRRVERSWAGLRSFAPDRLPVFGHDPHQPGFFWCAGQGGFGIQTAPASAQLCASLIVESICAPGGTDAKRYTPCRFT